MLFVFKANEKWAMVNGQYATGNKQLAIVLLKSEVLFFVPRTSNLVLNYDDTFHSC